MSNIDRQLRVFLCYSSEDKFIIERFYRRLITKSWIDLWLDEDRIFPGMSRDVEIERAVETADAVIACLSHNSVTKEGHAQRELKLVLDAASEKPEGAVFVIPLRLDECQVPRGMRHLQLIDFSLPEDREQAYNRLLRGLEIQADMVNKRTGKTRSAHIVSPQDIKTDSDVPPLTFAGFDFVKIPKGNLSLAVRCQTFWRGKMKFHNVLALYLMTIGSIVFWFQMSSSVNLLFQPSSWRPCRKIGEIN